MLTMACVTSLLVLTSSLLVKGNLLDITLEIQSIVTAHNNARRAVGAADMLQMTWDEGLERQAGEWSEQCRYKRPSAEYDVGSNLYYERDFVYGEDSTRAFMTSALTAWADHHNTFRYGRHCGAACTYVQMITSEVSRVGCAVSICSNLQSRAVTGISATLLVCFYSPKARLLDSQPFTYGEACSRCPRGAYCVDGLCSIPGRRLIPPHAQRPTPERPIVVAGLLEDALTVNDRSSLISSHNRLRQERRMTTLDWDDYLQRWATWIVNCTTDYPGPLGTYTNFHRLKLGDNVYQSVLNWANEGDEKKLKMVHGCRTWGDVGQCNHFTNVLVRTLTSMACATSYCRDGTRQLVCLYDNSTDRYHSYRTVSDPRVAQTRRPSVRRTTTSYDVIERQRLQREQLLRQRARSTTAAARNVPRNNRQGNRRVPQMYASRPGIYTKAQDPDYYQDHNNRHPGSFRRDGGRNRRHALGVRDRTSKERFASLVAIE